jgi:hypothetical protein
MVELRENQSFFAEMFAGGLVNDSTGWKNFDGDITGEVLVTSAVNFTHAAGADLLDDAVVAQLSADE